MEYITDQEQELVESLESFGTLTARQELEALAGK